MRHIMNTYRTGKPDNKMQGPYIENGPNVVYHVKEECSITNPTLIVKYNKALYRMNWFYIPDWSRYYYLNDIVTNNDGTMTLTLNVDPLASFQEYINNITCMIERSEYEVDPYLVDNDLVVRAPRNIVTRNIGTVGGDGLSYYLTTTGGN